MNKLVKITTVIKISGSKISARKVYTFLGIPFKVVKKRNPRKTPSNTSKIFEIAKNARTEIERVFGVSDYNDLSIDTINPKLRNFSRMYSYYYKKNNLEKANVQATVLSRLYEIIAYKITNPVGDEEN
jgi:hypothetical protein